MDDNKKRKEMDDKIKADYGKTAEQILKIMETNNPENNKNDEKNRGEEK